ncbi:MAG: OmpH family outer membrane protein [Alphaproteobacteria bacterium]
MISRLSRIATLILPVLVMALTPAVNAAAQSPEAPRIAVMEMGRIEREALAYQDLGGKFRQANEALLNELRAIQSSLEAESQELASQQAILAPEAFEQKRLEFEERVQQSNEQATARRQALEAALVESRNSIISVLREVMEEVANEYDLNLILDRSNSDPTVLFTAPEIEITGQILSRLDARIQTVEFNVAR